MIGEDREVDLVPTDANLLDAYDTFAGPEHACKGLWERVNSRPHRVTGQPPVDMLAEERLRLHPVASTLFTVASGTTRLVPVNTPMVAFEYGQYSVPHELMGQTVWVGAHGRGADEQVVITRVGASGPVEVARHTRATPGTPKFDDAHFPPTPEGALGGIPRPNTVAEAEFLA